MFQTLYQVPCNDGTRRGLRPRKRGQEPAQGPGPVPDEGRGEGPSNGGSEESRAAPGREQEALSQAASEGLVQGPGAECGVFHESPREDVRSPGRGLRVECGRYSPSPGSEVSPQPQSIL